MSRKKVKLTFIVNDSARKATYKKRKAGLMKKVSELSTLCGIDVCAIVYSPYNSQPSTWPSTMEANRIVSKFKKMPNVEQSKKMVNQLSFLEQSIAKVIEQLNKCWEKNQKAELNNVLFRTLTGDVLNDLSHVDLNDLGLVVNDSLKEITKQFDLLSTTTAAATTTTTNTDGSDED